MIFAAPIAYDDAVNAQAVRQILPTQLDTAGLRELGPGLHRVAFVSAKVELPRILDAFDASVRKLISGQTDMATERLRLKIALAQMGYVPAPGTAGTLEDLSSTQRLQTMLETNQAKVAGFAQKLWANDPAAVAAYPAWELIRIEDREKPRGDAAYKPGTPGEEGWGDRWLAAADASGDEAAARVYNATGRMVALKDSPLWIALGEVAADSLGGGTAPFAFGSGMGVEDVDVADAIDLGLLESAADAQPAAPGQFDDGFKLQPGLSSPALLNLFLESVKGLAKLVDGILVPVK